MGRTEYEYPQCPNHCTDCCSNFSNKLCFTDDQEECFGANACMILTDTDFGGRDCPFYKTFPKYKQDQEKAALRAKALKKGYNHGFTVFYDQDWHFVAAKCCHCGSFIHEKEWLNMPCQHCELTKLKKRLEVARDEDQF